MSTAAESSAAEAHVATALLALLRWADRGDSASVGAEAEGDRGEGGSASDEDRS